MNRYNRIADLMSRYPITAVYVILCLVAVTFVLVMELKG